MNYIVLDLEWNQPVSYASAAYRKVGSKLLFEVIQIGAAKVNELRIYHGAKYRQVEQAGAGDLVALPGLEGLRPGDMLGEEGHVAFHTTPMMAADVL